MCGEFSDPASHGPQLADGCLGSFSVSEHRRNLCRGRLPVLVPDPRLSGGGSTEMLRFDRIDGPRPGVPVIRRVGQAGDQLLGRSSMGE